MTNHADETKVRRSVCRILSTIGIAALVALPGAALGYEAGAVSNGTAAINGAAGDPIC